MADVPLRSEKIQKGIHHNDYIGDCSTEKTALPTAHPEKQD